jgi:hypothetical protein
MNMIIVFFIELSQETKLNKIYRKRRICSKKSLTQRRKGLFEEESRAEAQRRGERREDQELGNLAFLTPPVPHI